MDLETLKTFITLANLGNFTQTAQQHMVVQSTVSSRIRDLEEEVGTPLFIRERKNLRLTPAGEFFLSYANQIVTLENYALSGINMMGAYSDSLRIGSVHTLYDCHLGKYLTAYLKQYPDYSVKILLDHSRNLLNMLYDNIIDVCFTYRKFLHFNYECIPFRTESILLVTGAGKNHWDNGISVEDLKKLPLFYSYFIEATDSSWFHHMFPRHTIYPLEIDVGSKLIHFLEAGIGYSFLPESAVSDFLKSGRLTSIPVLDLPIPKLQSYIILKKESPSKQSVACLLDLVRRPLVC